MSKRKSGVNVRSVNFHRRCVPLMSLWLAAGLLSSNVLAQQSAGNQAAAVETKPVTFGEDAPIRRRGAIGIGLQLQGGQAVVSAVRPDGAAAKAGLAAGDRLIKVGGTAIEAGAQASAQATEALRTAPAGVSVLVEISRGGLEQTLTLVPDTLADEDLAAAASTVTYGDVIVPEGYRLRTILTRPSASAPPAAGTDSASTLRPAFLFVQGIYCASLDRPTQPDAVDTRLVHAMAKAGFITMRVDKPGLGDSQGPPCGDINFQTELDGYIAAARALVQTPDVDPDRIYMFGHSMGGVMAPYIVADVPMRGAAVYGTQARTWLEYSLENVRRQMELSGAPAAEVSAAVLEQSRMLAPLLIDKLTLGQVWVKHPELKPTGEQAIAAMLEPERMASRHVSFYHQLQDRNLADAWATVGKESRTHVLGIYGEYDWVTAQLDHEQIAAIVNANHPKDALVLSQPRGTWTVMPKHDHAFTTHANLDGSREAMGRGTWTGELPETVLGWIAQVEGRAQVKPAAAPVVPAAPVLPAAVVVFAAPVPPATSLAAASTLTQPGAFPNDWFGTWSGQVESVSNGKPGQRFAMELRIGSTDKPNRYEWTIVYAEGAARQERKYTLVAIDAAAGKYAIDENNGIVLDATLAGRVLLSQFEVMGSRISTRQELITLSDGKPAITFELLTFTVDQQTTTGGKENTPEVKTWPANALQRAVLAQRQGEKPRRGQSGPPE